MSVDLDFSPIDFRPSVNPFALIDLSYPPA